MAVLQQRQDWKPPQIKERRLVIAKDYIFMADNHIFIAPDDDDDDDDELLLFFFFLFFFFLNFIQNETLNLVIKITHHIQINI